MDSEAMSYDDDDDRMYTRRIRITFDKKWSPIEITIAVIQELFGDFALAVPSEEAVQGGEGDAVRQVVTVYFQYKADLHLAKVTLKANDSEYLIEAYATVEKFSGRVDEVLLATYWC